MTDVLRIAPLVEGHGEVKALPILIRKLAAKHGPAIRLQIAVPSRFKRDRLVSAASDTELSRFLHLAWLDVEKKGVVLIVLDGDDACPVRLAEDLGKRAAALRPDIRVEIVVANPEYEAWLIAGAHSLRGVRDFPTDLERPTAAEGRRDCKGWMSKQLPPGRAYSETIDQAEFTRALDVDEALAHSRSLRRLASVLDRVFARAT